MDVLTVFIVIGGIITVVCIYAVVIHDKGTTGWVKIQDINEAGANGSHDKENIKLR